jgi:uncharacterized protein with ParB-like and HNH nuclease domain
MTTALIELMGLKFNIPDYQRGYRWEEQEVTELLDDLWSFQKDKESGNFYCLQPIVLRKNEQDNYDVLDGQQRLTTIYLILVYLEERRNEDGYNQPLFSLNYDTRKKCEDFLSKKQYTNGQTDNSNIDFYHICKAYKCIDKWFKDEKHSGAKSKLVPILLDKTEKGNRNVKVIRYEIEEGTNPIEVFLSLNIGKIPLTDAELTKALLLQSDKYPDEELEFNKMKLHNIATEWDIIETTLQDKVFWYFLNNTLNEKSAHIEFIFDLLADRINADKKYFWNKKDNKQEKPKKYATFLIFSKYLQDLIDNEKIPRIEAVEKIWSAVVEYFEYFKEWFENRMLYHYIGFLLANKKESIDRIISQAKNLPKGKFVEFLEIKVAEIIKTEKELDKLVYENENGKGEDKSQIQQIFFLHNVITTQKSAKENPKFPFDLYKSTKWSLEHIYARNSELITDTNKQKEWLNDHIKSLSNTDCKDEEVKKEMSGLLEKMKILKDQIDIDNDEFNNLVYELGEIMENFSEFGEENVHSIKNLCLLDGQTNSQLNNSVFDVKREKIKKRELEGHYIPVCTKNVFLKAYTEFPSTNAYWTKTDREDYFKSVRETYNYFINKLNN